MDYNPQEHHPRLSLPVSLHCSTTDSTNGGSRSILRNAGIQTSVRKLVGPDEFVCQFLRDLLIDTNLHWALTSVSSNSTKSRIQCGAGHDVVVFVDSSDSSSNEEEEEPFRTECLDSIPAVRACLVLAGKNKTTGTRDPIVEFGMLALTDKIYPHILLALEGGASMDDIQLIVFVRHDRGYLSSSWNTVPCGLRYRCSEDGRVESAIQVYPSVLDPTSKSKKRKRF
jgi:hypothetical protein